MGCELFDCVFADRCLDWKAVALGEPCDNVDCDMYGCINCNSFSEDGCSQENDVAL